MILLWGAGSFIFSCSDWLTAGELLLSIAIKSQGFSSPNRDSPTHTKHNRIGNGLPVPCCSQSPQSHPLGRLWNPWASLSNCTREGPGSPGTSSSAPGFGLAGSPQVCPLTRTPPPPFPPSHFSVDDLIELCLFVPGAAKHVLEAINYRNVAASKRTLGTR